MTNHWIDIRNSDVIMVMGSNAAENHPISFKWIMKAREKGAKLISVDPRFTRTSAKADIYAPIRSGADIVFLNGMLKYIIENKKYDDFYIKNYTNAPFLVNEDFKMPGELDGVFSGYDAKNRKYNKKAWAFQMDAGGVVKKDKTLSNPRTVFQLLKNHVSRYDFDTVSNITGTPKDKVKEIYETYTSTGGPERAATIMYAMGWTQHTVGTQIIRTMAMIQLMLGNMGVSGGGVNALRGESNVQGSTDHCLLFHILPGYLKTPRASTQTLQEYNDKWTPKTKEPSSANWWGNYPKYSVSLLKAHYGNAATKDNDFGFDWLPKLDDGQNASWLMIFDEMIQGKFKGFFAWGQNPACSGANAGKVRKAMAKLDWMVNVNLFDNETGSFWKGPGVNSAEIKTEVFELPCARQMGAVEIQGS
jgi:formate dehydrogenase major subunit